MPNYCNYKLLAKGKKDNLERLLIIMKREYDEGKHMWRIFEAEGYYVDKENTSIIISGYCAWSVWSCMFNGPYTYNKDFGGENGQGVSITTLADILGLKIEILSCEPGLCFMEHYIIDNNKLIYKNESSYDEIYIGEHETYIDLIKDSPDIKKLITENDFNKGKDDGLDCLEIFEEPYEFTIDKQRNAIRFVDLDIFDK